MMTRPRPLLLVALLLGAFACDSGDKPPSPAPEPSVSASAAVAAPKVYEKVLLSPVWDVEQIYRSMQGPSETDTFALGSDKLELLWIVGFEATMVEPDGTSEAPQEFMCHTNLDMDPTSHRELFAEQDKNVSGRLFTLSQGQYRIDLPAGFGIPVLSSEVLSINTQVLNLNMKEGKRRVRHRVVMRYVRDVDVPAPYKALFPVGAFGLKLLTGPDGRFGVDAQGTPQPSAVASVAPQASTAPKPKGAPHHDHGAHHDGDEHASCLPGESASNASFDDGKGREFTGHWVVKPGREVNHTRVTGLMDLPWDTTLHYVAVHLHPFAETLELIDKTTGKTVYKAKTRQFDKGIGLAHVDFFSSEAGVPLYKDHEYEIVSVYNNTTSEDQDSMAVMNLYVIDKEFDKPDLTRVKALQQEKKAAPKAAPSASAPGGKLM
jgi:hypothetical protein